ncbi:hypothetical protein Tco_0926603 [Tanacetum coccineum]|uniref:Uncharacterized protein n=1 Tax=Tanacetum coccineum TaxID=301880 RepID=A0ABQ5DB57_9ASTR
MSTEVHQAAETVTTSNELDVLFGPLFDEYFNARKSSVLKSSAVNYADGIDIKLSTTTDQLLYFNSSNICHCDGT